MITFDYISAARARHLHNEDDHRILLEYIIKLLKIQEDIAAWLIKNNIRHEWKDNNIIFYNDEDLSAFRLTFGL